MEEYRKHEKKKKNTTGMPLAVNIGAGAGSLGMGGIVLFGGALVTATIVLAALAFKTRGSSKKSGSPSPELQSVDAPGQLEFTLKTDKDPSLDSQNRSDGVTSMKEMQTKTKTMQELIREEKQNWDEKVEAEDGKEEIIMLSVVGEDEERYVGCVFDENIEERYGVGVGEDKIKMVVECEEEQVVVAGDETKMELEPELGSEEDSCSETETVDGGELYSNGNKEQQTEGDETEKWLVSNEDVDVAGMEVEVESSLPVEDEEAAMEGACENQVTDKDCGDDTQTVCVGEEDEISVSRDAEQHTQGQGQGQGQANDEIAIQDHQSRTFPSGCACGCGSDDETAAQDEMVNKDKQTAKAEMMMMDDDVQESIKFNGDAAMQANIHKIHGSMATILDKNDSDHNKQKGACIYHSYSELLPWFTEISMVPSLLLIFILLALGTALRTWSSNHYPTLQ